MSVFMLNEYSTDHEILDFYDLYVEGFKDLCVWKGKKIINLAEYIKPTPNLNIFIGDVRFVVKGLGIIIYYTHNDDVITSIAFIEQEQMLKCYVKVKYLCANQSETINEGASSGGARGQGRYLLDFIFRTYKDSVILIEPATPELIPYYTKYNEPSFPYDPNWLHETFGFLVYGNLSYMKENCFPMIFKSLNIIRNMVSTLDFKSLNELYENTNSLTTLKDKLITKLDFLVKTNQIHAGFYEQILEKIINIKLYDIEDVLVLSKKERNKNIRTAQAIAGGKKRVRKSRREKRVLTKLEKKRKSKTKKNH